MLVGDKTERCPKLKVIDVSGTLAEVGSSLLSTLLLQTLTSLRLFDEPTTVNRCHTFSPMFPSKRLDGLLFCLVKLFSM